MLLDAVPVDLLSGVRQSGVLTGLVMGVRV
jgi:hypothetical protein